MKCVTVTYGRVRGRARLYPYWEPALYTAGVIKKTGEPVWKLESLSHFPARRSVRLALQDAMAWASELGVPYLEHIRHNQPIKQEAMQ